MPTTAFERDNSPRIEFAEGEGKASGEATWLVQGTESLTEAVDAVAEAAPQFLAANDKVLVRTRIRPVWQGPGAIQCDVVYVSEDSPEAKEPPQANTWRFSFDTTGGTHKITQSLATIARYQRSSSDPAPELYGAIGWDGEKVAGCEIIVPRLEFAITAFYTPGWMTWSKARDLARATGKTNSAAWLGFEEGELLYLGATGEGDIPLRASTQVQPTQVVFKFAASENRTNITIGEMTGINKKGWEYLWVRYKKMLWETGKVYPVPIHAYVEKVYRDVAFAGLFGFS
jgi:hypothetical protein